MRRIGVAALSALALALAGCHHQSPPYVGTYNIVMTDSYAQEIQQANGLDPNGPTGDALVQAVTKTTLTVSDDGTFTIVVPNRLGTLVPVHMVFTAAGNKLTVRNPHGRNGIEYIYDEKEHTLTGPGGTNDPSILKFKQQSSRG